MEKNLTKYCLCGEKITNIRYVLSGGKGPTKSGHQGVRLLGLLGLLGVRVISTVCLT